MMYFVSADGASYFESPTAPSIEGIISCKKRENITDTPKIKDGVFVSWEKQEKDEEWKKNEFRIERNERLKSNDWLVSRHKEQVEAGIETAITAEEYSELLTYRQALRDATTDFEFPEKPAWL